MDFFTIAKKDVVDIEYPSSINLSHEYRYRIINQQNIEMCKICAWILCIEYMRQIDGLDYMLFSTGFLYYYARLRDEDEYLNVPVSSKSIILSLLENGTCEDHLYSDEPNADSIQNANSHKEYTIIEEIEPCIETFKYILGVCKHPIVCDLSLNIHTFTSHHIQNGEDSHSVLLVGYTETHFIYQNSYGETWGDRGFGYVPYNFVIEGNVTECYSVPTSCIKSEK